MSHEPKTRRGRESRDRIIERAAELVAVHGAEGARLDELTAAAGVSKSQLYHYFADREELVAAAVGRRCGQVLEQLTMALGAVATLAELEQTLAGFVAGHEPHVAAGCPIGTLACEVAERNEAARLQTAAAFNAWERLLVEALRRMRDRGELRADAAPEFLGAVLLASIEGGLVLSQARRDIGSLRLAMAAALGTIRSHQNLD